ncbi:MAG: Crp/Fnr family transcriptional regulator [Hyphomicrobium sp.]
MSDKRTAPFSALEKIELWRGLPSDKLAKVHERCRWKQYAANEQILAYLDPSDDVYFIADGSVRIAIFALDGALTTLGDLSAGEIFGEMAAIDGGARCASIVARTPCSIASMSADSFREIVQSEPIVGWRLARCLNSKLRILTKRVYEFSALDVANRTRAEILRLTLHARRDGNAAIIDPAPTQTELASRISTTREVVAREFGRLRKLGIVERRHGALIVPDVDRLEELVREAIGE